MYLPPRPALALGLPLICALALPLTAAAEPPKPVLLEAEEHKADAGINEDEAALGSQYVHQAKQYQPYTFMEVPSSFTEVVTVWVRLRGSAIQMKSTRQGEEGQKEFKWNFDKPAEWTWVNMGSIPRDELGDKVLFIAGADAPENSGIDAVIFSPNEDYQPALEKDFDSIRQAAN